MAIALSRPISDIDRCVIVRRLRCMEDSDKANRPGTFPDRVCKKGCTPQKSDRSRQRIKVKRLSPIDTRGGARQEL